MHRQALALALSAVLLTACSGDDGDSAAAPTGEPSASSAASSEPPGEALADLTPEQVLERARAAFLSAGSVRIVGEFVEEGEAFGLDVAVQSTEGGRGTVSSGGVVFTLVRAGTDVWFQAPDDFWAQQGGPEAVARLSGKFVHTTTDDPDFTEFASFTDLQALADELFAPEGPLEKTDVTDLDGQQVLGLRDEDGSVLYVAATGEPVPVRISAVEQGATPAPDDDGSSSGAVDFRDYGAPVDLTPPSDVVEADELRG